MNASKVTIRPELLEQKGKLSQAQKKLLRKKIIKEHIQKQYAGAEVTYKTLARLTRYKTPGEVGPLITEMLNLGEISREPLMDKKGFTYAVTSVKQMASHSHTPGNENLSPKDVFIGLEQLARDFAWENNSDSLQDFMPWAKAKVLDGILGKK